MTQPQGSPHLDFHCKNEPESLWHDPVYELLAVVIGLHQVFAGQVRRCHETPAQRLFALVRDGPVVLENWK